MTFNKYKVTNKTFQVLFLEIGRIPARKYKFTNNLTDQLKNIEKKGIIKIRKVK